MSGEELVRANVTQGWVDEATEVIRSWEKCWEALPEDIRESPMNLGRMKSAIVLDYINYQEGRPT